MILLKLAAITAAILLLLRPAVRFGCRLILWDARRRFLRERRRMRRGRMGDLSLALLREVNFYDDNPDPFKWVK